MNEISCDGLVKVTIIYFLAAAKRNNFYTRNASTISGLPLGFSYSNCSSEIMEMLVKQRICIDDVDLKEEIGKGKHVRSYPLHTMMKRLCRSIHDILSAPVCIEACVGGLQ